MLMIFGEDCGPRYTICPGLPKKARYSPPNVSCRGACVRSSQPTQIPDRAWPCSVAKATFLPSCDIEKCVRTKPGKRRSAVPVATSETHNSPLKYECEPVTRRKQ